MHILIIGAAGMLGRKLTAHLVSAGKLGNHPIEELTLADIAKPTSPTGLSGKVTELVLDLASPSSAQQVISSRPDIIFHLAAVVSGEAEADFEKGYRSNLGGSGALFEAIRTESSQQAYCPRVVFCSSIAVFGPPFAEPIHDDFITAPQTSYGTQKAMTELLLADYSRRGFFQGIGIRLPTICVRPGAPNAAASGFFSNILREPLIGQEAVLPVDESVRHWFTSPRSAVGFLIHGATIDLEPLGTRRTLNMPGLSATVADQIEALRAVAGEKAVKLIRREPDPRIIKFVDGWPYNFAPKRALARGFKAETSFAAIIQAHIEDELGGVLP